MERLIEDANKVKKANGEMANLSIDSFADVVEAIHTIQGEMDITGTTAKEADKTISGSVGAVKASFSNLMTGLADSNANLSELIGNFVESVKTAATNIMPVFEQALFGVGDLISELFPVMLDAVPQFITDAIPKVLDAVTNMLSAFTEALPGIIDAIVGLLPDLINSVGGLLQNVFDYIMAHFPDILNLGVQLATNLAQGVANNAPAMIEQVVAMIETVLTSILDSMDDFIKSGFDIVESLIGGIIDNLPSIIDTVNQLMEDVIETLLDMLPDIMQKGAEMVSNLVQGIANNLPSIVDSAMRLIVNFVHSLVLHAPDIIKAGFNMLITLVNGISKAIPTLLGSIDDIVKSIWNAIKSVNWLELGKNIIRGLIDGIGAMGGALWDAAKNIAKGALDAIKGFFGIHSPSRLMRDQVGKFIPAGIAVGIEANTDDVKSAMKSVGEDALTQARSITDELSNLSANDYAYSIGGGANRLTNDTATAYNSDNRGVSVVQNIYSEAKTAADLMQEAQYQQERAVMMGV